MRRDDLLRSQGRGRRRHVADRDHFDGCCAPSARACSDIHPARDVSGVAYRYLYFASGKVLDATQGGLLEWSTEKKSEGCMFDDVRMDFDRDIADLQ